ncbi:MAG TPA: oligoendopeptidase, partial [Candidatus Limnocylindria bacterium]|nr:oligoendopeptidase [Candidatus Limnocylindria bacterium]
MAQATTSTGAESVRWNLSDLFGSPSDPRIEATLARALERAIEFEAAYRGKVAALPPAGFAEMMAELEADQEEAVKPEIYAYLLHSQNTQDPAAGRLLARVRE